MDGKCEGYSKRRGKIIMTENKYRWLRPVGYVLALSAVGAAAYFGFVRGAQRHTSDDQEHVYSASVRVEPAQAGPEPVAQTLVDSPQRPDGLTFEQRLAKNRDEGVRKVEGELEKRVLYIHNLLAKSRKEYRAEIERETGASDKTLNDALDRLNTALEGALSEKEEK